MLYIDNSLDNPDEDFPTQLGSHVYKLVEKITI